METIDIALVHPELIYPRGAERQLSNLARELIRDGHSVSIYTFEKQSPYIFDEFLKDCRIVSLGKAWRISPLPANYPRWYSMCRKLASLMGKHDVINCHNFPASWVPHFTKLPSVWLCNEPPGLYSYNQPLSARNAFKKIFYKPFSIVDRHLTKGIHSIAVLDNMMRQITAQGYPGREIVVIGSGAQLERPIIHVENGTVDVLFVGAMTEHKRPADVVEVLSRVKEGFKVRLHMVGSGELSGSVSRRAKELGVDTVMYGNVGEDKLYELYSLADLVVFVPEKHPWGIFPLEAVLAGVPTVISDECGANEVIGGDIPVVKTGDIEGISQKVRDMLENPGSYRKGLERAREKLRREYSWDAYTDRMVSLLRNAMEAKS